MEGLSNLPDENPTLKALLAQTDFVTALERGDSIQVSLDSQSSLTVSGSSEDRHSELHSDAVNLSAQVLEQTGAAVGTAWAHSHS